MLHIGCHLSSSSGYENMVKTALSIGADTFQFFTRNPRGSKSKAPDFEDMRRATELMKANNFAPAVAHAPYTLNPASSKEEVRAFAYDIFLDENEELKKKIATSKHKDVKSQITDATSIY